MECGRSRQNHKGTFERAHKEQEKTLRKVQRAEAQLAQLKAQLQEPEARAAGDKNQDETEAAVTSEAAAETRGERQRESIESLRARLQEAQARFAAAATQSKAEVVDPGAMMGNVNEC